MNKLPAKWKLEVTRANILEIGKWRVGGSFSETLIGGHIISGDTGYSRGYYFYKGAIELNKYEEISTEMFFKQVLKKEVKTKAYDIC